MTWRRAQAACALWLGGLLLVGAGDAAAQAAAQQAAPLPQHTVAEVLDPASTGPRALQLTAPPGVVLLQFADLREQARAMGRIVLFIEKVGAPRHRVMNVPEVLQWLRARGTRLELVTLGNNLGAEELARFFNTARLQGEPLTEQERELLRELAAWGLLREQGAGWVPGTAAHTLLTVPLASQVGGCAACDVTPQNRRAILEHELGHGEFAASAALQHHARWFWFNVLSPVARSQWQRFLTQRGYDTNQLQIVLGEMHAYLDHTHDTRLFRAEDLDLAPAALDAQRARYREGRVAAPALRHDPGYQLP
ncbi:MAG: hypothetical protein Q8S02_14125 [Hydrogenophaga sp.]|nr:hypothetical protein [Hydrogenophaga sp.]